MSSASISILLLAVLGIVFAGNTDLIKENDDLQHFVFVQDEKKKKLEIMRSGW
jgi:hypothetical protein